MMVFLGFRISPNYDFNVWDHVDVNKLDKSQKSNFFLTCAKLLLTLWLSGRLQ